MHEHVDPAIAARQLLAGSFGGLLSTHSLEHPGYPFGSLAPFMLDRDGLPLFLLSHLSQHTKNLDSDPRCSLTTVEAGEGDIQQRGRLSSIGEVEVASMPEDFRRFFRYFPHMQMYYQQLGFRFYRFRPARFHWNGGFATARWFSADRLVRPNPFTAADEDALVAHMSQHHDETLRHHLQDGAAALKPVENIEAAGIDSGGIDIRFGERLVRIGLPVEVHTPGEARAALTEMAAR